MSTFWIIFIITYLVLTHLIAQYIGKDRELGYGGSVMASILFSPLISIFVTLYSPKSVNP